MSRFVLLVWTLCVAINSCWGQAVPLYPDVPSTYSFNMPVVTPAYIQESGRYVFGGIYKFKVGEPNLAIFDVNGAIVLGGDQENHKQLIRLSFSNEREGPYIATPRGNFNYAYQLYLSEETKLALGISVGYVSRNYSAPSVSGQGNVMLPDGSFGIDINYKKVQFGMAVMQFINSEGMALQSAVRLQTYYHGYLLLEQDIDQYWLLKENVLIRALPEVTTQFIGGASIVYVAKYEFGILYYQRRGMAFRVSVATGGEDNSLKISAGYNSSFLALSPVWVNSFEIGLNYTIR